MQHGADVLAAFQDGETRLIYARPRAGGPLWLLPDGEARLHRARTKAELICPVLSCPEPELTTVARFPTKRDGLRHLSGGGHAPESLFHLRGKERIAFEIQYSPITPEKWHRGPGLRRGDRRRNRAFP